MVITKMRFTDNLRLSLLRRGRCLPGMEVRAAHKWSEMTAVKCQATRTCGERKAREGHWCWSRKGTSYLSVWLRRRATHSRTPLCGVMLSMMVTRMRGVMPALVWMSRDIHGRMLAREPCPLIRALSAERPHQNEHHRKPGEKPKMHPPFEFGLARPSPITVIDQERRYPANGTKISQGPHILAASVGKLPILGENGDHVPAHYMMHVNGIISIVDSARLFRLEELMTQNDEWAALSSIFRPAALPDLADLSKDDRMHLRMGQATRHDAQDQASRYRSCRCRFHAKSHRLQSRAHSQAHYRVRRGVS
jgi:hypothetical protein